MPTRWGCVREPASNSPASLPLRRQTTPAHLPRSQLRVSNSLSRTPAELCSRTLVGATGPLHQRLGPHTRIQSAAAAAAGSTPARSRGSQPCLADGCGSNGGNNSCSPRHVGEDGDGSDRQGSSSASSPIARLLAGTLLLQQLAHAGPAAAAWGSRSRLVSKRDEQRLLPGWEIEAFVDSMWDLSGPIMSNMGFSGLLGAASAAALKWVGRTLAAAVGMSLLLVQVLSHYNVLTVNWSVVHRQAQQVLDRTGDGRLDQDDFKRVLKQGMVIMSEGVPSVSGFLVGFVVGMKVF